MTATFDKVADIIAETSEIDRETITPESHTIDDLGIDSLDFLDIVFAIDKEFGIKISARAVDAGSQRRQGYHRRIFRAEEPLCQDRRIARSQGLRR